MEDFNSKYTGEQMEELLDQVANGGSGESGSSSSAYKLVEHGTNNTTFTLTPNTFHVWEEVSELILTFGEETVGVTNEYIFQFISGTTATTLTLPDNIKWVSEPNIQANKIYQVSILNNLGTILEFDI